MTTPNDTYRRKLIEGVRKIQAKQEATGMTDEQIMEVIWSGLGIPHGTPLSDEQLQMIASCDVTR